MAKTKQPSQSDVYRLGSEVASVKAQSDPKAWKSLVKNAHKRGFTVGGVLSGQPDALKERTQSSMVTQAKKTVGGIYDPQLKSQDTDAAQVNALATKRKRDEQSFTDWLASERSKLNVQTATAQSNIATARQQALDSAHADWTNVQGQAVANVQAQRGVVSDMHQANALDLQPEAARSAASMASTAAKGSDYASAASNLGNLVDNADMAQAAARVASINSDTWTALDNIRQNKDKIVGDKGSALASEVARLTGNNTQTLKDNRDFQAAADKLDVQSRQVDANIANDLRTYGLAKQKFNLATWTAQHTDLTNQAKVTLGYDKIKADQGKAAADRKLKTWVTKYNKTHGTGKDGTVKVTAGDRAHSSTAVQGVDTALTELRRLHGKGAQNVRQHLIDMGYSSTQVDVANDLFTHSGKLSERGRVKARVIGILNPEKVYGRA